MIKNRQREFLTEIQGREEFHPFFFSRIWKEKKIKKREEERKNDERKREKKRGRKIASHNTEVHMSKMKNIRKVIFFSLILFLSFFF